MDASTGVYIALYIYITGTRGLLHVRDILQESGVYWVIVLYY